MFKRISQLLYLIGIPMDTEEDEKPKPKTPKPKRKLGPYELLVHATWWVSMPSVVFTYSTPATRLPDYPWVRAYVELFHEYMPIIFAFLLVNLVVSLFTSWGEPKQEDLLEPHGELKAEQASADVNSTQVDSACPMCGSQLTHRNMHNNDASKHGFWECSTYPKCWYRKGY